MSDKPALPRAPASEKSSPGTPGGRRSPEPKLKLSAWQRWEMTSIADDLPAAGGGAAAALEPLEPVVLIDEAELVRLRLLAQQAGDSAGHREGHARGLAEGHAAGLAAVQAQAAQLQALTQSLPGAMHGAEQQVADDLLDYTEGQEMTGKPHGLDLKEHKVTLPLIAALREMPSGDRARVETLFAATEPEDEAISEVISIVRRHGGLDYARRRGEQFAREAEDALADLPEGPARSALVDAISYVVQRRW